MKDYDEIRKRYLAGERQRHIAKTLGISRNTVAKYCEGAAVPWERKTPVRSSNVLTDDVVLPPDSDSRRFVRDHPYRKIFFQGT